MVNRWKQIATVLAIACVPLLSVGARLRGTHPRFDEWFNDIAQSYQGDPGLGLAIGTWWIFVMIATSIMAVVMIALLYGICWLGAKKNVWRVVAIVVSSLLFLFIGNQLVFSLRESIQWGFYTLSAGEIVGGVAVICGYIAVWNEKQNNESHPIPASRGEGQEDRTTCPRL